jgi:hypothetical protein
MTSLTEWAAISDIVGNAAVVISLLVVAFTVAQNTTAIRAQIDNHWYDSCTSRFATDRRWTSLNRNDTTSSLFVT